MNGVETGERNSGREGRAADERYVFESRGLALLEHRLQGAERASILELGPALRANISYFCDLRCRVFVEDLRSALCVPSAERSASARQVMESFERRLENGGNRGFKAILCWDLLSFLSVGDGELVLGIIARHSAPDALLLAIDVGSNGMPAPSFFRIAGRRRIEIEQRTGSERLPAQRALQSVCRHFPRHKMLSSTRLRNGFVEQVFAAG